MDKITVGFEDRIHLGAHALDTLTVGIAENAAEKIISAFARCKILGREEVYTDYKTVHFKSPDGPWQAFKHFCFPRSLKSLFPVRYDHTVVTVEFKCAVGLPGLDHIFPPEQVATFAYFPETSEDRKTL